MPMIMHGELGIFFRIIKHRRVVVVRVLQIRHLFRWLIGFTDFT